MRGYKFISGVVFQLTLFLILQSCFQQADEPENYQQRVWDFGGRECGYALVETPAGEFIITGSGPGFSETDENVYVARLSESGEVLGEVTYGGNRSDLGRDIAVLPDGGYIIAGSTQSGGTDATDILAIKLSKNGDSLWSKTYGGVGIDEGWSVAALVDSGFIIAGSTRSFGHGARDVYVVRADSKGDTVWTRCFGGTGDDGARAVVATADGGCLIAGSTYSFGAGNSDVYIIKCSAEGDSIWAGAYGSIEYEEGNCAVQTKDLCYAIAGSSHLDAPAGDVLLLKIHQNGNPVWEKKYGSYQGDCAFDLAITQDGGFVMTGYYTTPAQPNKLISSNVYLIKTDSAGTLQWEQDFGGESQDIGYGVVSLVDAGFVIIGGTQSFDGEISDILWLKAAAPLR